MYLCLVSIPYDISISLKLQKIHSLTIYLVSYSKNETKGVGTLRIGVLFENKQPLALEVFPR